MTKVIETEVINALESAFVVPVLSELVRETGQGLTVDVVVFSKGEGEASRKISIEGQKALENAAGQVRILLKSGTALAQAFTSEAIIKGLAAETGFSGFSVRGKVDATVSPAKVRVTSRINQYNVWSWSKEFSEVKGDI